MLGGQLPQLADHLDMPAELKLDFEPLLERSDPLLLQEAGVHGDRRLEPNVF